MFWVFGGCGGSGSALVFIFVISNPVHFPKIHVTLLVLRIPQEAPVQA